MKIIGPVVVSAVMMTGLGGAGFFLLVGHDVGLLTLGILLFIAVSPWVLLGAMLAGSKHEWTFLDDGFAPKKNIFIPWQDVLEVSYVPRTPNINAPSLAFAPNTPGVGSPWHLTFETMTPDAALAVIGEFVTHVAPDRVDPSLIVVANLFDAAEKIKMSDLAEAQRLYQRLAVLDVTEAARVLERVHSDPLSSGTLPWTTLLLAQCYLLMGNDQSAMNFADEAERLHPGWSRARLVRGIALARLGYADQAAEALRSAGYEGADAGVLSAAAQTLQSEPPDGVRSRALSGWTWVTLWAVVWMIMGQVSRLLRAMAHSGPDWMPVLSQTMSYGTVVAFAAFVGSIALFVVRREIGRGKAAKPAASPTGAVEPAAPSPVIAPAQYASGESAQFRDAQNRAYARRRVWSYSISALAGLFCIGVVAARIAASANPSLLDGVGGEWLAVGHFRTLAMGSGIVAFGALVWGVSGGALSAGPQNGDPGIPIAAGGSAEPTGSLMKASISTGWLVAALGAAGLCAAAAFALSAWPIPLPGALTTDPQGNMYAAIGDQVYRWDNKGNESVAAQLRGDDLADANMSGLRVAADGTMYVSEMGRRTVRVYAPNGALQRTLKTQLPYTPAGRTEWNLSVAPMPGGPFVLDRGLFARFGESPVPQTIFDKRDLRWAEDVDMGPDGAVYVADTTHGKVHRIKGSSTQSVDCLGLSDGYGYPSLVRVAPDGTVYAVVRKAWGATGTTNAPLSEVEAPYVWMGRLVRVDFATKSVALVDAKCGSMRIGIDHFGFLKDGSMVVAGINESWFYRVPLDAPENAERITDGQLGARSRQASVLWQALNLGPQLFWALAIMLPILIGIAGVKADRRKQQAWGAPQIGLG